jgi:cell division protein FtsQ
VSRRTPAPPDRAAASPAESDADGASPAQPGPGGASPAGHQARHRDPWRTAFFGVLVLAILGFAGWAVLGSSLLVVRQIEVRGEHLTTSARVKAAAGIRLGEPLATLDASQAERRIERIAPVLTATVSRSWPDTVIITVQERTPALAVAAVGGYELVDEYGVTVRFSRAGPAGLAVLTQPPAVLRGNAAVRAAALVMKGLPARLRRRISSVSAPTAVTVTLRLKGGVTVVWGGPGQTTRKEQELDLLLGTGAHYVDVSDPGTAVTQR